MKNSNKYNWRCCVCDAPESTLHEVAHGRGVRVQYGIRHHLQIPLCQRHHEVAHGIRSINDGLSNSYFEELNYNFIYGHGEYSRCMLLVNQHNHAELEKTDDDRIRRLKEYLIN